MIISNKVRLGGSMGKKSKVVRMIAAVIIIAIVLTPIIYVQINKIIYKHRVMNYLIKEEGYEKEHIQSVKGVWGVKLPPFLSVVVFNDEPYVEYIYFAHNGVIQFDYLITEEGKLMGITEQDLKHYVPRFGSNSYIKRPE